MEMSFRDEVLLALGKWLHTFQQRRGAKWLRILLSEFPELVEISKAKDPRARVAVLRVEIENPQTPMQALEHVAKIQEFLTEREVPSQVVLKDEDPDGNAFAELRVPYPVWETPKIETSEITAILG